MDNRKLIFSTHLAVSAVVWFMTRSLINWLSLNFYQLRKLPGLDTWREVVPVVIAVGVLIFLWKSAKVNQTLEEVVAELKKVTWPSVEDVKKSTVVVMICIILASGLRAIFDLFFGKVVGWLLNSDLFA